MTRRRWSTALAISVLLLLACSAPGQIGALLLTETWGEHPRWIDLYDEPMLVLGGNRGSEPDDITILRYDSFHRLKLMRVDADRQYWFGVRGLTIALLNDHPLIPGSFFDVAAIGAVRLNSPDEPWVMRLAGGVGTANDGQWRNPRSYYGIATLQGTHRLSRSEMVHLGVDYHGNRTVLPRLPLPYAMYERIDRELAYMLGFPFNRVTWDASDDLTFSVFYSFPTSVQAMADYALTEEWSVFAEFSRTLDAFFQENRGRERLFYEVNRVSAGLHWARVPVFQARVGLGYAAEQELSRGIDLRDLDTVLTPSDGVALFLTLHGSF